MTNAILKLSHIKRHYQQASARLDILSDVNLEIAPGQLVALLGPSGCGKSTLLHIAGLLDTPTAGEVIIAGEAMQNASDVKRTRARLHHVGFVYQFHHLLPEFSAVENVMMPQLLAGVDAKTAKEKATQKLETLGLKDRLNHRPAKLSGGEQQRVAIARALVNNPALLLADEPTGNLDPHTADHVFDVLMQAVSDHKLAVLMATHNIELAQRMDKITELNKGVLTHGR